jgi:hypothetical protein
LYHIPHAAVAVGLWAGGFLVQEDTMSHALIGLLITILVMALVLGLIIYLIDVLPIDARFKQIARVAAIVLACLVVIFKALPLIGVAA